MGLAILAVCVIASAAEQPRFRGGFGGGEGFYPPRFPTPDELDGDVVVCRLMYRSVRSYQRGLGWGTDYPFAEINFSIRLSELTRTRVSHTNGEPKHFVARPTDEWLSRCPFVLMSDPGTVGFTEAEVASLRAYLLKGGFLWADDFWGVAAWEDFVREIGRVLPPPEYSIVELGFDHLIFRTLFEVTRIPQVPSIQFWRYSGGATSELGSASATPRMAAISDAHGRIMVLMTHNTDIADAWEREADDPEFFYTFSPEGYALGLNVAMYALTH